MTSTQVELQFSSWTALTDTRAKRLGYPGLCAKTINANFAAWVDRWRNEQRIPRTGVHLRRPYWVGLNRTPRQSGFDLHKSDVHAQMVVEDGQLDDSLPPRQAKFKAMHKLAVQSWNSSGAGVDKAEKVAKTEKAKLIKKKPSAAEGCHDEETTPANGPLQLASLTGRFPIEPDIVDLRQDSVTVAQVAKQFVERRGFTQVPGKGSQKLLQKNAHAGVAIVANGFLTRTSRQNSFAITYGYRCDSLRKKGEVPALPLRWSGIR